MQDSARECDIMRGVSVRTSVSWSGPDRTPFPPPTPPPHKGTPRPDIAEHNHEPGVKPVPQEACLWYRRRYPKRPDSDNIDAGNGLLWEDDSQVLVDGTERDSRPRGCYHAMVAHGVAAPRSAGPLLTVGGLTHRLRCSEQSIRKYLRKGWLPGYKAGRRWRIPWAEVEQFFRPRPLD